MTRAHIGSYRGPPSNSKTIGFHHNRFLNIWVFPKNRGKTPKMDGENKGKPYWNWLFGGTIIFGNTHIHMKFIG